MLPTWALGWVGIPILPPVLDHLCNPGSPWPSLKGTTHGLRPQEELLCPVLPSMALSRAHRHTTRGMMLALNEPKRIVFTGTCPQQTSYSLHPSGSSVSQHLHFGSSYPKVCGLNRVTVTRGNGYIAAASRERPAKKLHSGKQS